MLPQLKGTPLVTVSAVTGKGLDRLHAAILKAHDVWNRRVTTAQLNRWLMAMTEAHPPAPPGGRRIRLRYMTQANTRPPAFVVFGTRVDQLPDSYQRYLLNAIRRDLDFGAVPVRINLRSRDNPFAKD